MAWFLGNAPLELLCIWTLIFLLFLGCQIVENKKSLFGDNSYFATCSNIKMLLDYI